MNLFIDIGNTAIKFALDDLKNVTSISTKEVIEGDFDLSFLPKGVDQVFVSSVVPKAFEKIKAKVFGKYGILMKQEAISNDYGVYIDMDNPQELGDDLFYDLVGANATSKVPLLIVDLGTANKFLYIDENHRFYSAQIIEGLYMALHGLANSTALLPHIEDGDIKPILKCNNTVDVLLSSAYNAQVDAINGAVARYQKELGNKDIPIILTGGNVKDIYKDLNFKYQKVDNLCLKGLQVTSRGKKK